MRWVVLIAVAGAAGWAYSRGWLDPGCVRALVEHERARIPDQVKDAVAAGRRAAARREAQLDRELAEAMGHEAGRGI
jgi:hypothetical protein